MTNFLWTLFYIAIGVWILSRLIAYVIQKLLKRYLDISLRFGKVGLLSCGQVQMSLHKHVSIHVEVEKIWLSSSFVSQEVRKPIVICIEEIRIQVDVTGQAETLTGRNRVKQPQKSVSELLGKILLFCSYGGLRINNMTVMLLKTMVPDCLIHFSSPEICLDISAAYDRFELCVDVNNLSCKALGSYQESVGHHNCLAEFSLTCTMDAKLDKKQPTKLMVLKTAITKPQMMITEGFIQSLQAKNRNQDNRECDQVAEPQQHPEESATESQTATPPTEAHWPQDNILSGLQLLDKLQEVTCDISDLAVTIVRETKQRSLSVSLKLFHLGFHDQSYWQATDVSCNVFLEDFSTNSMQAKLAGLSKIVLKGQLLRDSVDTVLVVNSGFFHYHHEEVQYWLLVFSNIVHSPRSQSQPLQLVAQRSHKSVISPQLLAWMVGKSYSLVLEMSEMSSTVSSAACAGLHWQLSQVKVGVNAKPGHGGLSLRLTCDNGSWSLSNLWPWRLVSLYYLWL